MQLINAPEPLTIHHPSVFLAGSIENGKAIEWQDFIITQLQSINKLTILNPRRSDWDSSWKQEIGNPQFYEQVSWELSAMENADVIAVYFAPDTKAPITLMELGLFAQSGKALVCCPEGFWRKGNVDIVCERFGIPMVPELSLLPKYILQAMKVSLDFMV